jgi:DNA-binding FadR family transcriptional regulator
MSTVYHNAIRELGGRIVQGSLEPGTRITLEWLGNEFEISRTIAREVVQVLASMGLVRSRRRTGVTVLPCAEWDAFDPAVIRWRLDGPGRGDHLEELAELRAAVEPAAAAMAATRAGAEVRAELLSLAERMEETGAAGDLRTFLEHDVAFHRLLLRTSGNAMFAGLCDVVEEVLRGRTDHHLMPPEPKPEARDLHTEVAVAVAGGDAATARAAMSALCLEVVVGIAELSDDSPGAGRSG